MADTDQSTWDAIKQYVLDSLGPVSNPSPDDDARKSPMQQIPEGLSRIVGSGWQAAPAQAEPYQLSGQDPFQVMALRNQLSGQPSAPMAGWADDPSQGGLGLAVRQSPQPTATKPGLRDYLAEQYFPGVQLSWREKNMLRNEMLDGTFMAQRQQLAQQLAAQQQKQQDERWDQNFKIATNPELSPGQKMQIYKERAKTDPISAQFAHGVNEKVLGEFESVSQYMPHPVEYYMNGLKSGDLNFDTITTDMEIGKETRKMVMEARKPALHLQTLQRLAQENPNEPAYAQALATLEAEMQAKQSEAKTKSVAAQFAQPKAQSEIAHTNAQTNMLRAPKEVYSGLRGPDGQSVTGVFDPTTGQTTEMAGTPIQRISDSTVKLTPEQAGRFASVFSALDNLNDIEKIASLPDGKIDRQLIFSANLGGLPFSQGRDLNRWVQDAIEAKLRLQTGAAANKDEVVKEAKKFVPSSLDSDSTIRGKFRDLRQFMVDTVNLADPTGDIRSRIGIGVELSGKSPMPFGTALEQLGKQHPNWSEQQIFEELRRRGIKP